MPPSSTEIPVAVFVLGAVLFAVGCLCGWAACLLFRKPKERIILGLRNAKGQFMRPPAEFEEPKYPAAPC
jgi:hypothetical protein